MKLEEIRPRWSDFDIRTQDLMKWGFTPQRQGLTEGDRYVDPPFHQFYESGDAYFPIKWTNVEGGLRGKFSTPDYTYEIQIDEFPYDFNGKRYMCANLGFVVFKWGQPTTNITPIAFSSQVFGTIQNGIGEKAITLSLDAFTLVATNSKDSRMKLYNHLADRYAKKFGTVYKNIKTERGVATIVISHRVPDEVQSSLYKFAVAKSDNK